MKNRISKFLVLTFFAFTLFACVPTRVVVHKQPKKPARPPKVLVSTNVPKPGPSYVWIDGHYSWNSRTGKYVWKKGHWVKGKHGKKWVPGHWVKTHRGQKWVNGHWR